MTKFFYKLSRLILLLCSLSTVSGLGGRAFSASFDCSHARLTASYDEAGKSIVLTIKSFRESSDTPAPGFYSYCGGAVGTLLGLGLLGPVGLSFGAFAVAASFGIVGGVTGSAIERGGHLRQAAQGVAHEIDVLFDSVEIQIPAEKLGFEQAHLESFIQQELLRMLSGEEFCRAANVPTVEVLHYFQPLAQKAAKVITELLSSEILGKV